MVSVVNCWSVSQIRMVLRRSSNAVEVSLPGPEMERSVHILVFDLEVFKRSKN